MPVNIPTLKLCELFACLLLAGLLALLPLFSFKWSKLTQSYLFIKTLMWLPIFIGFIAVLYANNGIRLLVALVLGGLAIREWWPRYSAKTKHRGLLRWQLAGFTACGLMLPAAGAVFDRQQTINLLVTICIASPLSDVAAFFFGNYVGHHKLPQFLNNRKSWEGVGGQFVGALLGVILLRLFGIASITWLWLPIALGTVLGDLINSYVKRRLKIKDWGSAIPGHGGYLDRFSSLFGGLALATCTLFFLG
ncbi:MAG TPA: phosphatidate cytidylyltransferase [Candidatus Saccharimonadales bacterium]|nr:phosphatidate cytidylyltransferase [Candidatus Saccharimonadales bacterium]